MGQEQVVDVRETEEELVARAQVAVSQCNWVVGECAHKWTKKYARGRTDGDFAAMLGLTPDQAYQRRRVWETFSDVHGSYASLKWSHFYAALTWDDAPECLQWADENQATVAEMKAWRRALRGEDLTVFSDSDEWGAAGIGAPGIGTVDASGAVTYVPSGAVAVRDPADFGEGESDRRGRSTRSGSGSDADARTETVGGVARGAGGDSPYAPYRSGAGSPAPQESEGEAPTPRPQLSPEQLITRIAGTLERVQEALTPEVLKAFKTLPEKKRTRFLKAMSALSAKAARLV